MAGTVITGAGVVMIPLTSPVWASAAGVGMVVGGSALILYDWYSSMDYAIDTGYDLREDLEEILNNRYNEIDRQCNQ